MTGRTGTAIPVAKRIGGFVYAIRNIVAEARKVEASGRRVRYLNIGDPITFGFETPPHLIEAVTRALREGHNSYAPSVGILPAREAVAAECDSRGMPVSPDRVVITSGTSEGIELTLTALAEAGDEVLVPVPTYPLYTAVLAKIGAKPVFYRTDPSNQWLPDLDHVRSLVTPATRALVVIDPNNPTGATYPVEVRRELIDIADRHGFPLLADEVYADLAYDGPVPAIAAINPDAPIISFSSLSKAYLAPGWRAGWMAVGRTDRLDDVLGAVKKLADGRLCATGPMEYGITAALTGDRSHQQSFRAALRERAELTTRRLNAIDGITAVAPSAAFYSMPRVALPPGVTDEQYVLALLRATGVLCVYGSGFGTRPEDGFFRVVFLASPSELSEIYDLVAEFTREFLDSRGR
ncbi:MAG TPA: aminotransferase class I/II-fold pyridoxal phosphate-dependent enzyme [Vicinamibacterales bacterium]|jgi:alanine-synthesizing transaminase|nr:aminotransferase class I/II-fold pyridoxal phosphate-dependent enzyme [Vicinamibacterales bacterium]